MQDPVDRFKTEELDAYVAAARVAGGFCQDFGVRLQEILLAKLVQPIVSIGHVPLSLLLRPCRGVKSKNKTQFHRLARPDLKPHFLNAPSGMAADGLPAM